MTLWMLRVKNPGALPRHHLRIYRQEVAVLSMDRGKEERSPRKDSSVRSTSVVT